MTGVEQLILQPKAQGPSYNLMQIKLILREKNRKVLLTYLGTWAGPELHSVAPRPGFTSPPCTG